MRDVAGADFTAFILLLRSGMRGGDVVGLTWREVKFPENEIERITQKRRKRVLIPLSTELRFVLELEHDRRRPQPEDRVLLNPTTGTPLTRGRLYERMLALGRRAGVPHSHPHRFRDTFSVQMLLKGASLYEVAELLGDTVKVVEHHYASFTPEIRERVRRLMNNSEEIENIVPMGTKWAQRTPKSEQVQ